MARSVAWTESAWADLEGIADYIAQDSRFYAASFVRETRDAARSLSTLAERGRVVPEMGNPTIRELLLGNYRLVYRVREQNVEILGLIHGARDLAALWQREERPQR